MPLEDDQKKIIVKESEDSDVDPDETEEDTAHDDQDFDLICEGYVPPNMTQHLPEVIIIGAKKGGTRALIEFLKLHPQLKAAGPEIHFFNKHYDKGVDWYISRMPPAMKNNLVMEKTPGYFHHPQSPQRLHETTKKSKLLLILRDPVKRLVSDYNQFRSKNLAEGKTYPMLEELVFNKDGSIDITYPPLQRSIYHHHITRWFKYFPKEQIHIVHGEAFIKEPWTELRKVEQFLDVPHVITEDNFFFNQTKGFYCGKEMRTTGVWECVKRKCLSKSKGRPKPPLAEGTLDKLYRFFAEHNKIFYALVGHDYGWKPKEQPWMGYQGPFLGSNSKRVEEPCANISTCHSRRH